MNNSVGSMPRKLSFLLISKEHAQKEKDTYINTCINLNKLICIHGTYVAPLREQLADTLYLLQTRHELRHEGVELK